MATKCLDKNKNPCRTCLSKNYSKSVILDEKWAKQLEYCLGLEVSLCNYNTLCKKCACKIDEFTEFKKQSHNANKYWLDYLAKIELDLKVNIKVENEMNCLIQEDLIEVDPDALEVNDSPICYEYEWLENDSDLDDQPLSETTYKLEKCNEPISDTKMADIKLFKNEDKLIKTKVKKQLTSNIRKKHRDKTTKTKIKRKQGCMKTIGKVSTTLDETKYCEKCNINCKNKKSYEYHCKVRHGYVETTLEYNCGLCDFIGEDKLSMNKHFFKHVRQEEVNCQLCDFVGSDLAEMLSHRYSHCKAENRKFECVECDKTFLNTFKLEFHYRSVHLNKKGGFCNDCNKELRGYRSWRNHYKKHKEKNNYECDICGIEFLYRNQIITHLQCHNKVKTKICHHCGLGFTRMSNVNSHIRAMHTKHEAVKCSHCNRTFKSQYTLAQHMRLVNANKPYECNVCFKKYETKHNLDTHMIWHSDARPFSCDLCNAKFKAKGTLKVHKMRHMGTTKLNCSYCDKGFLQKRNMLIHESIHTGVRLYKCPHCVKSFNHKTMYVKHLTTHS